MDDPGSRSQLFPFTTVVILAVAMGGWLFFPSGMRSFRPEVPEDALMTSMALEDVPARLWQDPFSAVLDYRDELRDYRKTHRDRLGGDGAFEAHHKIAEMQTAIAGRTTKNGSGIVIMPIMVLGGQHAESIEERRRQRFAVVAGLGRRNFVPELDSNIGFLETFWETGAEGKLVLADRSTETEAGLESGQAERDSMLLIDVPFEWYEPTEKHEQLGPRSGKDKPAAAPISESSVNPESTADVKPIGGVLVMWIDEIQFFTQPYGMVSQLLNRLVAAAPNPGAVEVRVIGPATSTGLRFLLRDIEKYENGENRDHLAIESPIRFYSTRATRWPELFDAAELATYERIREKSPVSVRSESAPGKNGSPILVVTVSHDHIVLKSIIDELELRGKDLVGKEDVDLDHIAMVGEWDTHYGRALTRTLRVALCEKLPQKTPEQCREMSRDALAAETPNVHQFHYLRGIDGLVPGASAKDGDTSRSSGNSQSLDLRSMEQPEGRSQLDYVRRLADQIATHDRILKRDKKGRIRVVGVVGSDLYDKQLILQALRSHFPTALFFTTDLDARLFHPSQYHWSRNLIVGSSFGLSLRRELQGTIPPFRNTYQTSTFLGTQLALKRIDEEIQDRYHAEDANIFTLLSDGWQRFRGRGRTQDSNTLRLLIGDGNIGSHLRAPRIFEVARSGGYDLSWSPNAEVSFLHPERSESRRRILSDRWPVLLFVVALFALVPFSATARRWFFFPFREQDEEDRPVFGIQIVVLLLLGMVLSPKLLGPVAVLVIAALFIPVVRKSLFTPLNIPGSGHWSLLSIQVVFMLLLVTLLVFIHIDARDPGGEPFELLQGISVWPTEILRLFAVMMCVYFLINAAHDLRISNQDIENRYGLPKGHGWHGSRLKQYVGSARNPLQALTGFFEWMGWRITKMIRDDFRQGRVYSNLGKYKRCEGPNGDVDTEPSGEHDTVGDEFETKADAADLWADYRRHGSPWRRAARVFGWLITYIVFLMIVFQAFESPVPPIRGSVSAWIDMRLIIASSIGLTLVALFVLDANNLTAKLIRCFEAKDTRWPRQARRKAERQRGIANREAAEWLEINLIAERTAVVGRFVIHPFLVLTVLLFARNSFFDLWTWPFSLLIVFGVLSGFIVASGLILRRAAESARSRSVRNLGNLLARLEASTDTEQRRRIPQVKMVIDDIQSIRTGAFSSWGENPVVRAVLLPFGGTGIVILFDLFTRVGL